MNIDGLFGFNKSKTSVNKLFAVYGNDIVDVDTGLGYSQNITSGNKAEFATYQDYCFFVNGQNNSRCFDGTNWLVNHTVSRMPIAKYIHPYGTRLYVANLTINGQSYPSKVWQTDLPYNNKPRWGLEWGTDLSQTAGRAIITSAGSYFKARGIKIGDPVWILTGNNAGEYTVSSIDHENRITLTEELLNTASNSSFIVGGNSFDVNTDDNDYIRGLGENSNRLLIFKLYSLHRYNGSSLFQVKGVPGTCSNRSIVNVKDVYTLWFHASDGKKDGVYMYDGTNGIKISKAIQPYIKGIASSIFPNIVAWREGDWYRCYVGDITNAQRNISVSKAVISYHVADNKWSVDPINKVLKCVATFLESNVEKIFFGDDSGEVFQTPSGYSFDGSAIPWAMETGVYYPEGTEVMNKFTRIQVVGRDLRGIRARYKLYNKPKEVDTDWQGLGELDGDRTELKIPIGHNRACGINLRLEEISTRENALNVEKISGFYTVEGTKFI